MRQNDMVKGLGTCNVQCSIPANKIPYADILRILATITAIVLHTTAPLLYTGFSNMSWWWTGNVLNSASRWCVPLFTMLSGMLLLSPGKTETASSFLKKRFLKVLIPLIFWGAAYYVWKNKMPILHGGPISMSPEGFIRDLLGGKIYFHLWFIYMIVGLYLVTPVFRVFARHAEKKDYTYFLAAWLAVNPLLIVMNFHLHLSMGFYLEPLVGFLGYYVLGYYLHTYEMDKKHRRAVYIIGSICFIITVLGTYLLTAKNNGILEEHFYGYLNFTVIAMSAAVFIAFKNACWPKKIARTSNKLISSLSSASFGMYLLHPIILETLSKLGIDFSIIHPVPGSIITVAITVLICYVIISIMRRIPYIKMLVP